jgi:ribose/xylose/arabinose/galactoside ABC-type transport system permease subunit
MKNPHRSNGSLPLQFAAAYRRVVRHSKIGRSMSALGQKRTHAVQQGMSALHPKATSNAT